MDLIGLVVDRGKMLGGSSAINALIYQRCAPSTYDGWGALNPGYGWDFASLKPYFDKSSHYLENPSFPSAAQDLDADKATKANKGPWKAGVPKYTNKMTRVFTETAASLGIASVQDINSPQTQLGGAIFAITADEKGRRHSTAQAYLDSKTRKRSNLTIGVGVQVTKVLFSDPEEGKPRRAIGVEFAKKKGGKTFRAHAASEVILSTGAVMSPQLLQVSGIGPQKTLEQLGIDVVADLPGVGENLQDHLTTSGLVFYLTPQSESLEYLKHELKSGPAFAQWLLTGSGPMTSNLASAAVFARYNDVASADDVDRLEVEQEENTPDIEILVAAVSYLDHALVKVPAKPALSMGAIHIAPTSRGNIRLASKDIWQAPLIDPNYLGTENDRKAARAGVKLSLKLAAAEPLKSHICGAFDFAKGKGMEEFRGKPADYSDWSEEDLEKMAKRFAFTMYHPVGTCKMAPIEKDSMAVVDGELRVHGVEGLRVVDASVMPEIVRGHPQAAVVAIAEKAADFIKLSRKKKEQQAKNEEEANLKKVTSLVNAQTMANGNGHANENRETTANGNGHAKLVEVTAPPPVTSAKLAPDGSVVVPAIATGGEAADAEATKTESSSTAVDAAAGAEPAATSAEIAAAPTESAAAPDYTETTRQQE